MESSKNKIQHRCAKIVRLIIMSAIMALFLFCVYQIYDYYQEANENSSEYARIAEIAGEDEPQKPNDKNSNDDTEKENEFNGYADLYAQNHDMVGWIQIEGTVINYPIMQTKDNPFYYLHRNFYKAYSAYGVPFLQANCVIGESDNLILYGHHMNNGSMFAALEQYKDKSFYEEHKQIRFNTLTEEGTYEIVAAFKTTAYGNGFQYYQFVNAESEDEYNQFVDNCRKLSIYDTGVSATYGDKLITLSTCEYSLANGRMVVVAKRIDR